MSVINYSQFKTKTMEIKNVSTEMLLQWYANAVSTASCDGHTKGKANDELYCNYALELKIGRAHV